MIFQPHELGTLFETSHLIGLLGNRNSNIESLKLHFPQVRFKRIKQTHGNQISHTSPHTIDFSSEADAHYCNELHLGLCISTADCIPLFVYHPEPTWVMGIHAGWRGIQNRIIPKALSLLKRQGCDPKKVTIFVGPHIQQASFEVENDVRNLLLASFSSPDKEAFFRESSSTKSLVDLPLIMNEQLLEFQIEAQQIHFESKDTVRDLNYHSFRRDKEGSGRQLSWISLK